MQRTTSLIARVTRLPSQPLVAAVTAAFAVLAVAVAWLGATGGARGKNIVPPPLPLLSLGLVAATVLAYQFPLPVYRKTKVYMASVPFYLLAVLVPSPLAATAAGLGAMTGELSVREQRGTFISQIVAEAGRRTLIVLCGALVAHAAPAGSLHVLTLIGAAVVLEVGDIVTYPLVRVGREPPVQIIVGVARAAYLVEAVQYLLGLLGALAVAEQFWALGLLALPAVLVYMAFRAMTQATEAQQAAEKAQQAAQDAQRLAYEAIHARDEFLTAASHELGTALTDIVQRTQQLRAHLDRGRPLKTDRLREHVMPLAQAGERLAASVEEVMDAARLQMGQPLTLHPEMIEMGPLAHAVVSMLTAGARPQSAPVIVDTSDPAPVVGDRRRLERVLCSIVDVAIAHSPPDTPVHLTVAEDQHWVMITTRQNDAGLAGDELSHLFNRFYRASARGSGGTGIGLAGAKAIVEQHGGHITVESAADQGTTIVVFLPRHAAHDEMSRGETLQTAEQKGSMTPA